MIKFVHTADLHLDSPFSGVSMTERRSRRDELKKALISTVRYCDENKTDLLLICGDLFDGAFARSETVCFAAECFSRIPDTKVFIAPGNHDCYGSSTPYRYCNFPDNVYIFTSEELQCFEIPELGCAVYGFGYNSTKMTLKPVSGIHPHNTDRINILMAHGDIDCPDSPYYNINSSDIAQSGLDYVALGHIHKPSELMYFGDTPCAYSGCPVGRDFGECGKKGIISGIIDANGTKIKHIPVTEIFYEEITVDVTGKTDNDIIDEFREKCASFGKGTRVRATVTGERDEFYALDERLLAEMFCDFDSFTFCDRTTERLMYKELLCEYSLRGEFARALQPYVESEDGNIREKGLLALRYGLDALKK